MHSRTVSVWLPIRGWAFDAQEIAQRKQVCIAEFLAELPSALPLLAPELSEVSVAADPPPQNIHEYLYKFNSLLKLPLFFVVCVTANVHFPVKPEDEEPFLSAIAGHYLLKAIDLALNLSDLAYPGALLTSEGAVTIDGRVIDKVDGKLPLPWALQEETDPNDWPAIQRIPFNRVVAWATALGFSKSSIASSRVQKALAAFTHVIGLSWHHDGEILFRAMQGIEAFYCDGVGDLRNQISKKSEIWLGSHDQKKNVVGHLYDLRSKFIHGSASMQYWHEVTDAWMEDPKSLGSLNDGSEFSSRLLLCTLQKCILQSVKEISWSYAHETIQL